MLSDSMKTIKEKHSEVSNSDIRRAEMQLEKCAKCLGLSECTSNWGRGIKPVIRATDIAVGFCKFLRERQRQAKINSCFKMAQMPPKYIGKTFSDYEVTAENSAAVKAAKNLLKNPQSGLYIYGKPGTGKTFLAAIIAQELISAGKSVIFGDVPSVLDDLKNTFDRGEQKLSELMKMLASVDMLVLDDLGTEVPTEWAVERLYKIVNDRYNEEKPLIVTSNYKPNIVGERMNNPKKKEGNYETVTGDRIISRLLQMCKGVMIKGEDRRFWNEFAD